MKSLWKTRGLCFFLILAMLVQVWIPVSAEGKETQDTIHAPEGYEPEEGRSNFALRGAPSEADALLIEDTLPWDSNANSLILGKLGIPFQRVTIAAAEKLDFSRYSLIVTADDQGPAFYAALSGLRTRLERYVMNGGVLLYGICDGGWAGGYNDMKAPGDVKLEFGYRNYNRIADADHPIVTGVFTDGAALDNTDMYGYYASHETFIRDSLPPDANVILEDDLSRPTLVEYPIGDGFVIASGLTWEHNYYHEVKFAYKAMDDLFAYAYTLARIKSTEEQAALGKEGIGQGTSCAAGDPVDAATGNYFTQKNDLVLPGKTPLAFTRFYNSMDTREGALGKKWRHNYEVSLERLSGRRYRIAFEDGHTEDFIFGDDGIWYGPEGKYRSITRDGERFAVTAKDGTAYTFDGEGRLVTKKEASGLSVTLRYREGRLIRAESAVGSFSFTYGEDGLLRQAEDSAGRTAEFVYKNGCLAEYRDAQGNRRSYRYDGEGRMLAEADGEGNDLLTNEYDSAGRVVKQGLPEGGTASFVYDDVELTTTYTAPNGAVTVFARDGRNRITGRAYPGNGEKVEFNEKNQIISVTDDLGNVTRYEYDAYGNVSAETDPNGNRTEYCYDENHNLLSLTDAEGQTWSYTYNKAGKPVLAKDPLGNETRITYDDNANPVSIQLPDGTALAIAYDEKGNPVKITDGRGGTTVYTYNEQNRPETETDPNGNRTEYTYTPGGDIEKIVYADGSEQSFRYQAKGQRTESVDEEGRRSLSAYNPAGQKTEETDAAGNVTRYTYDSMGNVIKVTNPDESICTSEYDKAGRLVKTVDEEGNTTSYSYDEAGNLEEETDALGNRTQYRYDRAGQLTERIDALGNRTAYTYSKTGLLTRETDALGNSREYAYDALGRLIRFENEEKEKTSYEYDAAGNRIRETDAAGHSTRYHYDGNGNVVLVEYADGEKDVLAYDANNNLIQYQDAEGETTRYTYDARNRLTAVGNALGDKQELEYSPSGNLIRTVDQNGGTTRYAYNALNRLTEVTDALGQKTRYAYDARGNLTEIRRYRTDEGKEQNQTAQELVTRYRYDKAGRLTGEEKPSGGAKVYGYDACGNLVTMTDEEKNTIRYEYDAVQNLTKAAYSGEKTVEYAYDALGRLTGMKDWNGETSYEWDALGRLSRTTDGEGRTTEYSWNCFDKKEALTYPDGSRTEYGYDSRGRLTQVTDARGGVTTYRYDKAGQLLETRLPNGACAVRSYDVLKRLLTLTDYNSSGEVLNRYEYGYDKAGNKTEIVRDKNLNAAEKEADPTDGRTVYSYDALNRLTEAAHEDGKTERYAYDEAGNRIRKVIEGRSGTWETLYQYDRDNRLTRVEGEAETIYGIRADRPLELTYDARGNLVELKKEGETQARYEYDEANQLVRGVNQFGMESRYSYDGTGTRIGMTIETGDGAVDGSGRKEYHYLYDVSSPRQNILLAYGKGNRAERFTYGQGLLEEERSAEKPEEWTDSLLGEESEAAYVLTDEQGSLTALLDEAGEERGRYTYDEYGTPLTVTGRKGEKAFLPLYGYAGYQYDLGTGLYYTGARYYMPQAGRFVSEDAEAGHVRYPSGQNAYVYGMNNPLRYIDPDGNSVKDITYGFASALDDNVLGGFGKFLLKKILHTGERVNDSDYDYYLGRVAGDVVSALIGGVLSAKGVVDILGSIVFGGGITVTSGGTLAIGGIAICVEGVLAGSVEVVYGGTVVVESICSMSDDLNNLKRASGNQGGSEANSNTGRWNKGSHDSAEKSLKKHFEKHGEEVGAKDPQQYLRKAEEFARNLKGARKAYNIPGETPNVTRYYKNGKYIDLASDGSIISFGKQ